VAELVKNVTLIFDIADVTANLIRKGATSEALREREKPSKRIVEFLGADHQLRT